MSASVTPLAAHPRFRPAAEKPVTRDELQRELRRGKSTIFAWVAEGMPVYSRNGAKNTFLLTEVYAWLQEHKGWSPPAPYDGQRTHHPSRGEQNHG